MNKKRVRIKSTCEHKQYANKNGACEEKTLDDALNGRRETVYVKIDGDYAYTAILFSDLRFIGERYEK